MPIAQPAAARDKLVTIQQSSDAVDAGGHPSESWATLAQVWMSKEDVGATEKYENGQVSAPFDSVWEMPYLDSMDPERVNVPKLRRLLYRGRFYDIQEALLLQRHEGRAIRLKTLAASTI